MTRVRSIIIDDEKSARISLERFLKDYCKQVEVVAMAADIIEARRLIDEHKPQLIFLDIEMPHGNAFDLLEGFDMIDFEIIFVTAFSQYAVQAFNLSAAHYLLKPVDIDQLISAVDKVSEKLSTKTTDNHTTILLENLRQINSRKRKVIVPLMEGFDIIKLEQIIYMEADDNFVHIHLTTAKSMMACRSLKFYEEQLSTSGFFRIHRKLLINLEHVERYRKTKSGMVEMSNGKELEMSASKKKQFVELFRS